MPKNQTNESEKRAEILTKEYIDKGYSLLLTSREAALFLGQKTDGWLRKKRSTGHVAGVEAPPFVRRGGRILYKLYDLVLYVCQLPTSRW